MLSLNVATTTKGQIMQFKEWSGEFEIGIGTIDKDHRNLFDMIRQLGDQIASNREAERVSATIGSLLLYVKEHFEREELFMRRAGFPGYEAHKKLHDDFRDSIFSLQQFHENFPNDVDAQKIVSFLEDWLITHIVKVDGQYKPYLLGEKQGDAPIHQKDGGDDAVVTVSLDCPADKERQVRHFINLISHGSEEGVLVEAAVEKITKVQNARRDKKARELFGQ